MTAPEREGGKQSHLRLSGTYGARGAGRALTWGSADRSGAAGREGAPAVDRTRGPGTLWPVRARRGESWRPGAPCASHAAPDCGGRSHPARGAVRGCLRPGDPKAEAGETRRSSRARPARPSAALPAALRSGLGLRAPLCWHLPTLPTALGAPPAAPRRRRPPTGYAAPPARPAGCAESAAAAAGTREAMSPARARESARGPGAAGRLTAELRGPGAARPRQRPAPCRSLSRRRPRAARRPACVSPSRRSLLARPASLPPSSGRAGPGARSNPCAPAALGGPRARPAHLRWRRRPSR